MDDLLLRQLFAKWVNQDISEAELTRLMEYLSKGSSESHRQTLSTALYEDTITGIALEPGDADRILNDILRSERKAPAEIQERRQTGKIRTFVIKHRPGLLKYAAILAGGLLIGAMVLYFNGNKAPKIGEPQPVIAGRYITEEPDRNRATLILEDGQKVDLDKPPGSTIRQGQTEIVKNDTASLRYRSAAEQIKPAGFNTLITPRGARYKVQLADGSEIWMNAETQLRYPAHFGGVTKREIFLDKGEAWFKVRKNALLPFVVNTAGTNIQVLGTEFNVNTYSGKPATTLLEGSVKLTAGNASVLLEPGQQGIWQDGGFTRTTADTEIITAWKDDQVICVETPLEDVMNLLGRQYDFTVEFTTPLLKTRKFGGRLLTKEHLEDVLAIIQQTAYVKFSIQGKKIIVSPANSN